MENNELIQEELITEETNEVIVEKKQPTTQEEILEELKECYKTISTSQAKEYQRKWRRLSTDWESVYEEEMNNQFYELIDHAYAGQREETNSNYDIKLDLIEQAKHVLTLSDLKTATKLMDSIFENWKQTRSAGKERDDELWNIFHEVRDTFYKNKKENFEAQKVKRENAHKIKLELIEKAKELSLVSEFKASTKEMNELFDQWKKAGSAPRDVEDKLWEQFNGYRQEFYSRKDVFIKEQKEIFDKNYQTKLNLIEKAEEVVNSNRYSRENNEIMKELNNEWKVAGYCGRKDQEIWEQFRSVVDKYFQGLTEFNQNRKQNWIHRLEDSKKFKLEQIEQQKRKIERLNNDMVGTISEKSIADMKLTIEDLNQYINELEEDIVEIDSKLAN